MKRLLGFNNTYSGTESADKTVEEMYDFIISTYRLYVEVFNIDIQDKRILEIGPGDNIGVALLLIAKGARQVICVDAFYSRRDREKETEIYKKIFSACTKAEKKRLSEAIIFTKERFKLNPDKLRYLSRTPIEKWRYKCKFDLVFSRSVLEHVSDVKKTISNTYQLLDSAGKQVHYVSTGDHKILSEKFGPFEWLKIGKTVWGMMVKYSGHPNRVLIPEYRKILVSSGFSSEFLIARYHGFDDVLMKKGISSRILDDLKQDTSLDEHKRQFVLPYRDYSDQDLLTRNFLFFAKK
ncbi:methyltransferase domain-containing protein [Thermoproteota archaeon]